MEFTLGLDGLGGSHDNGSAIVVSVIIPCWNDSSALRALLQTLSRLSGIAEVLVADASDNDDCRALAIDAGARVVTCAAPNRGAQMNAAAACARGDVLLFQHADTELTHGHLEALRNAMKDPSLVGGAFHRRFDERHGWLRSFERIARWLSARGGTFYGDQSIFVRRKVFEQLGGFAEIPLMEDVEFSRRLRRAARTVVLDPPIGSSPRHHTRHGALRTSFRNAAMMVLYRLGFPADKLHAWYYRHMIYESVEVPLERIEP